MAVDEVVVDLHQHHHLLESLVDRVVVLHHKLVLVLVLMLVVLEVNKLELVQMLQ